MSVWVCVRVQLDFLFLESKSEPTEIASERQRKKGADRRIDANSKNFPLMSLIVADKYDWWTLIWQWHAITN